MNTYDDAYMRLKKIAIADPPTKRRGYDDYYLIVVFDIRIAINARGSNGLTAEAGACWRRQICTPTRSKTPCAI